jgi:hypothetical protein
MQQKFALGYSSLTVRSCRLSPRFAGFQMADARFQSARAGSGLFVTASSHVSRFAAARHAALDCG